MPHAPVPPGRGLPPTAWVDVGIDAHPEPPVPGDPYPSTPRGATRACYRAGTAAASIRVTVLYCQVGKTTSDICANRHRSIRLAASDLQSRTSGTASGL